MPRVGGVLMGAFIFACVFSARGETPSLPEPAPPPSAMKTAVREALRQTFKYDPSIRKKAEEEGLVDDGVIRLEPFVVSEQKVNPYLVRQLDHTRELYKANKPSLANGIGKKISPNVSVGVMPYDYKSLPSPISVPAWNLINIRL